MPRKPKSPNAINPSGSLSDALKDVRVKLAREDQALLEELATGYGTTYAEAIRRAVAGEVERMRQGRMADRLDTLRESMLATQEQLASIGRRVEASIALQEKSRGALLEEIGKVHNISFNCWLNTSAMIEVHPKADEVKAKAQEILRSE